MDSSSIFDRKLLRKMIAEQSSKQRSYPFWPNDADHLKRLAKIWKISEKYDWKRTLIIDHHNKFYVTLNTLSNIYIGNHIRKTFGLNRNNVALINTLGPSIAFSTVMGATIHFLFVTSPILSTPLNDYHAKQIFISTFTHTTTSVVYPIIFVTGSSIYFSAKYMTKPIPDDLGLHKETRKHLWEKYLKIMLKKNYRRWSILLLFNVLSSATLTSLLSMQIKELFLLEMEQCSDNEQGQDNLI